MQPQCYETPLHFSVHTHLHSMGNLLCPIHAIGQCKHANSTQIGIMAQPGLQRPSFCEAVLTHYVSQFPIFSFRFYSKVVFSGMKKWYAEIWRVKCKISLKINFKFKLKILKYDTYRHIVLYDPMCSYIIACMCPLILNLLNFLPLQNLNSMESISQMISRATNDVSVCPISVFQTSGRLTVPRTLHKREISPTECWGCASIISPPCTLLQPEWDVQETFFVAYSGWALASE